MTTTEARRIHSDSPEHHREDLVDALAHALGDMTPAQAAQAARIVASIESHWDTQEALRQVLVTFGPVVFGAVTCHALEHQTSMSGPAESLTTSDSLISLGLCVHDLHWPTDALGDVFAQSPEQDYHAGVARAAELGYDRTMQLKTEKHLVHFCAWRDSRLSKARAGRDGIAGDHWDQIVAATFPRP